MLMLTDQKNSKKLQHSYRLVLFCRIMRGSNSTIKTQWRIQGGSLGSAEPPPATEIDVFVRTYCSEGEVKYDRVIPEEIIWNICCPKSNQLR